MRWNAFLLLALPAFAGCAKPAANVEANVQVPETALEPEPFGVDPAASAAMPEAGSSTSTYSPPKSPGGRGEVVVASNAATLGDGPLTHTVARGDTLYSIARKYYNDPGRWKTIYEANRDKIPSPKALPVGKSLVIP